MKKENVKKTIVITALVLVLAAVAVVCGSCSKKEEPAYENGKVSYTVVNNTGKNVTEIVLSDNRSENKVVSKPGEGGLPDGQSVGIELPAMLENNGADVMFSFTVEGGNNLSAHIGQTTGTITMVTENGSLEFKISEPGK